MRRRWPSSLVVALILLDAGSCRATPNGCDDSNSERCLWNRGLQQPVVTDKEPGEDDVASDSNTSLSGDAKLNDALTQMVDMMRAGLEWSLVNARARALCASEVEDEAAPAPAAEGPAAEGPDAEGPDAKGPDAKGSEDVSAGWRCDTALVIETQGLQLEASAAVLSLSATPLDEASSAELLELARARFDPWCASDFEELEGTNHLMFYRCALPEGPFLVVARFPRDLEAGEWQVSIAVLDAG